MFEVQGKIISFNEYENSGIIIADDGIQYVFSGSEWTERYSPKAGDNVDFMFDGMGSINRVSYQPNKSYTTTPPLLHKAPQDKGVTTSQEFGANNRVNNNQHNNRIESLYIEESNYGIIDWTKKAFNNYATFSGRARRKEYWLFYLATIIIAMAFGFIEGFSKGVMGIGSMDDTSISSLILTLVFFIPTIAAGSRRLHDIGRSGWWQLLWCIPLIGWIIIIILLAKDTSPQTNEWGSPARRL